VFLLDDGRGLWRILSLDGLRGVAAVMVLASHAYQYSELHIPVLGSLIPSAVARAA
jgi:peptidoglycan/LPS O-acetylase OafA/YrhL